MPGRSFAKPKLNKIIKSKKTRGDQKDVPRYVDAGQLEVEASLKDIPDGDGKYYDSMERKFGCLPWHLRLHKVVEKPKSAGQPTNFIEVYLLCSYKEQEHTWCAKATGVLRMEKWPEKLKDKSEAKTEHKENFIRKFNQNERQHKFVKKFPVPTSARYRCGHGNPAADSPYLKNGHFKFQLDITVHNVRKVHFPIYDFQKKTPMCNAIVKISGHDGNIQRFHVNKEYLSMHSDALGCMFSNPGFVEGSTGEVELKDIDTKVFNEFLAMIYPSRQRPHIKYMRGLLEFARMFFIPTVTAICEQRLLVAEEAEMGLGERLLLADTYGLFQLKSQIMQSLGQDTTKLEDKWTDKLSQETLQMLLRKQKQAKAAEDEAAAKKKRDAEAMEVDPQPSNQRPRRGDDAVRSARRMGRGGQRRPQHGAANRRN